MKCVCHTDMVTLKKRGGVFKNPLRYLSQKMITQFSLLFLSISISQEQMRLHGAPGGRGDAASENETHFILK